MNATRSASVLFVLTGLFGGTGVLLTVEHIARRRELPLLGPIRGLSGPFESLGIDAMVTLGAALVAISAVELLVAALLWRYRKVGGALALALFPPSLALWVGFALPLWLVVGPLRVVLVLAGWRSLR